MPPARDRRRTGATARHRKNSREQVRLGRRNEAHRMRALARDAAATQRHFLQHAQLDEFVHAPAHRRQLDLRARVDLLAREIESRPPTEEIDDLLLLRGELAGTAYLVIRDQRRIGNVGFHASRNATITTTRHATPTIIVSICIARSPFMARLSFSCDEIPSASRRASRACRSCRPSPPPPSACPREFSCPAARPARDATPPAS